MSARCNESALRERLESEDPKKVRAEKARIRKQRQRDIERGETLEQTHRRRQDDLKARQQDNLKKVRAKNDGQVTNAKNKYEQKRDTIEDRERRGKITHKRAEELLNSLSNKHRTQLSTLNNKLNAELRGLKVKHGVQNETQKRTQTQQRDVGERKCKRRRTPTVNEESFELRRVDVYQPENKFNTYTHRYTVRVNNCSVPINVVDVFTSAMMETIRERGLRIGDRIRIGIDHSIFKDHPYTGKLTRIPGGNLGEFLKSVVVKLFSSKEYHLLPLSEITILVHSIKVPSGCGYLKPTRENAYKKRSIIVIKNKDTMCMARAIVTAMANIHPEKWTKTQVNDGFNRSRVLQGTEAKRLHEEAGVNINDCGNNLDDALTFAEHLNAQINIYDSDIFHDLIASVGPKDGDMIYLQKIGNHFNVIKSMPGFLAKTYYCHECKKAYKKRDCHKCPNKCLACFESNSECNTKGETNIVCDDCNRTFFGQECYDEHKRNRATNPGCVDIVCAAVKKCLACKRTVQDLDSHICGYSLCNNCNEYCERGSHKCYMRVKQCKGGECTVMSDTTCKETYEFRKDWCVACKTRTKKYGFYDFEAGQETGVHEANYCHYMSFDGWEVNFKNASKFSEFALSLKGYTHVAHNARGYDLYFVLKYCVDKGIAPFCIFNGSKIMYMSVGGTGENVVRFIDSLNFVQSRLADFPKTFGLTELKKGWFPHLFNKVGNQDYVGPMPSKKYYNPDQMSKGDRERFLKWYQERVDNNYVFNFRRELREYCRSDVDIPRRSMMQFRENYITKCNIDPLQYITIASVSMAVYRCNFMPANKIAVVKDTVCVENFSKISINWLRYHMSKDNTKIKHALNGGEYKVDGVGKVDGYCEETNTVYEYQGCFWHGCPKCFSPDTINVRNQIDMGELQARTVDKSNKIRELGYNLVEMYDCGLRKDHEFKIWCKENDTDVVTPLNPRDAFFGGRTNVTKLRYKFGKDERGRYVNFVSLYPTVQDSAW